MANIVQLKDSANAVFYPQTHEKAVIDSNGVNLQTKLASIVTPSYVTAWDGESTPVVANIPAGVTVTYDGTDYTGTLVASASTTNKTYLVSTGTTDNYNRYVTQLNGSTYSWQPLGSTEIDLSDYATKAELGQLDQKVEKQAIPVTGTDAYVKTSGGVGTTVPAPTSGVSTRGWKYSKFNVTPGDIVIVNGHGGSSPRLWAFVDDDDVILSVSKASLTGENLVLVAPDDVSYIIINDDSDSTSYFVQKNSVPYQFMELRGEIAEEDERLDQKLIQLTGAGGSPSDAGASTGDIFYNTSTKLLRMYNGGSSFTTIPYQDGAIYTMYGRLYLWNGTDLVPATLADQNAVVSLILKTVGCTFTLESNGTLPINLPVTIPSGTRVRAYIESYSSDAEGNVALVGNSIRSGSMVSFGNMSQGAVLEKVITKDIDYITLYPVPTTFSFTVRLECGDAAIKKEVEALDNAAFDAPVTYDSDYLEEGYYDLTGTSPIIGANTSWRRFKKAVSRGDIIDVYTKGGSNGRAYALTDKNDIILTVAASGLDTLSTGALLPVAADGYLYVNCDANSVSSFKVIAKSSRITPSAPASVNAPCMFNPKADLKKSSLRILDIGNSYTNDATHYLPDIIAAAGITDEGYSHYKATRSSASFKTWVDCFNDEDTLTYNIGKISGDTISGVETGEGDAGDGGKFRTCLAAGWDIILIHQVSGYANDYDSWQGLGPGGYLRELIRIIRQSNPNAAIGFLLVHSYASGYSGNSEGTSLARWQNIAASAKKLVANYGIDFVIPYGTAVQNLRASTINTDKNDFSNDGTHLADGIGDYVAACCYFQMVYAPRFDKCILGNTFRKTDLDETSTGVLNIDNTNAPLAQKAAFAAAYDWYNLHNPDDM